MNESWWSTNFRHLSDDACKQKICSLYFDLICRNFCQVGKRCSADESWTSLTVSVWPGAWWGVSSGLRGNSHAVIGISVAVIPVSHANIPVNKVLDGVRDVGDGGLGQKSLQSFTFCFKSVTTKSNFVVLGTNILKKQPLTIVDVNNFFSVSPTLRQ